MYRVANGAGLVRDCVGDGVTNPPRRIGGELVALCVIRLFYGTNQSQVSLLDLIKGHLDSVTEAETRSNNARFSRVKGIKHSL